MRVMCICYEWAYTLAMNSVEAKSDGISCGSKGHVMASPLPTSVKLALFPSCRASIGARVSLGAQNDPYPLVAEDLMGIGGAVLSFFHRSPQTPVLLALEKGRSLGRWAHSLHFGAAYWICTTWCILSPNFYSVG